MKPITAKKWMNLDVLIWVIAILGIFFFQALPGPRPLDDSYITYRYAWNIRAGNGFVYNLGEKVQGTTTPLYTLILTLSSFITGREALPVVSFAIALVADVISTWLLFRIARRLLKQDLAALALAVVFLLHPLRLNVAGGGMETSLFICLLLAMVDSYIVRDAVLAAAVFGALAILTRMDAVLAVGPVLLHALWRHRSQALKAILLGAAILAPWYAWAAWYFGSPVPSSITAKMVAYPNYTPAVTLLHVLTFLGTGTVGPYENLLLIFPGLVLALFLCILGLQQILKENREALILVAYPFLYFLVMTVQHAPLFFLWYYLPLMPGLLVLYFCAFLRLFQKLPPAEKRSSQALRFGAAGLALLLLPALLMAISPSWSQNRQAEQLFRQASATVREQAAGKLIYAPDIGVIGWELANASILDPIGLVSPVTLRYLDGTKGANLVAPQMVQDLRPDLIIAREEFITYLVADPTFQERYQPVWQKESTEEAGLRVLVYRLK